MRLGRLLVATRSAGKLRELRPIFAAAGVRLVELDAAGIPPDPVEEGIEAFESFKANALAKARYFFARSGMPTVAEDSGLEVTALGGAPGVRSKRWSGRADAGCAAVDAANNAELARRMAGARDRRARYVCAAALVDGAHTLVAGGIVTGRIADAAAGVEGFGYDPWFVPDEGDGRTFGQMTRTEKQRLSHRGRAFAALFGMIAGTADRH